MRFVLVGLASMLALTACTPIAPSRTVAFADGTVIATTPTGYCVDGGSSQPANGFAVMVPCATLGEDAAVPEVIGVATVQVGPAESGAVAGSEIALRDFLITDAGNALLSNIGKGEDVTILSTQAFNGRVMVHFTDKGTPPLPGLQGEEWRAFTDVNGRLVTIAVRGLATAPLQDGPGAGLLKLILGGIGAAAEALPEPVADNTET
ncbi:MAG: dihydroxy-acid dehydratase [Pseudomonadota bacterium]